MIGNQQTKHKEFLLMLGFSSAFPKSLLTLLIILMSLAPNNGETFPT